MKRLQMQKPSVSSRNFFQKKKQSISLCELFSKPDLSPSDKKYSAAEPGNKSIIVSMKRQQSASLWMRESIDINTAYPYKMRS